MSKYSNMSNCKDPENRSNKSCCCGGHSCKTKRKFLRETIRSWVDADAGCNRNAPIMKVCHANLKRFDEGEYKSECPVCKHGVLLVSRDQQTLRLTRYDFCVFCAQRFKYIDDNINSEEFRD